MKVFSFFSNKCWPQKKCRDIEHKYTSYYDLVLSTILNDVNNVIDMETNAEHIQYRPQVKYSEHCIQDTCANKNIRDTYSPFKEGLLMYAHMSKDNIDIKPTYNAPAYEIIESYHDDEVNNELYSNISTNVNPEVDCKYQLSIDLDSSSENGTNNDYQKAAEVSRDIQNKVVHKSNRDHPPTQQLQDETNLNVVKCGPIANNFPTNFILNLDRMLKEKAEIVKLVCEECDGEDREQVIADQTRHDNIRKSVKNEITKFHNDKNNRKLPAEVSSEVTKSAIQKESNHTIETYDATFPSVNELVWGGWRNDENLKSFVIDFC